MTEPITDLRVMLAEMQPELIGDPFRFVVNNRADAAIANFEDTFAVIREAEGTTFIVKSSVANEVGHDGADFARITLNVHSALDGVGLTAAVAQALAKAGIACNVIAAYHHDHIFVPWADRQAALTTLNAASSDARR